MVKRTVCFVYMFDWQITIVVTSVFPFCVLAYLKDSELIKKITVCRGGRQMYHDSNQVSNPAGGISI